MKTLTLLVAVLFLSACGGSGSGGSATTHIPDITPHTYTALAVALSDTASAHPVMMHQVCDFGLSDVRDETTDYILQDPNPNGAIGCGPDSNYTLTIENTGTLEIYVQQTIDGVQQPQFALEAGQTFNFQRGF